MKLLKIKLAAVLILLTAMASTTFAHLQSGAGQDMKDAGSATKAAAKDTGRATKKTAKKTGHAVKKTTKKVVHKSAKETKKGADKVEDKTN
jgi:hypothetical protein